MALVFVAGALLVLYPFVSETISSYMDDLVIMAYNNKTTAMNSQELSALRADFSKKNEELADKGSAPGITDESIADVEEKDGKIDPKKVDEHFFQDHTIGVIDIPKINLKLPIFDRTNEMFLQRGAAKLEGTSYPTGGPSTHSVLSAHRGLPSAKLFTDLPELKKGDIFLINVLGDKLAYKVDQLKTVLPTDISALYIEQGKDMVTLITCTPYMINSHRLLVRGHRVPYLAAYDQMLEDSNFSRNLKRLIFLLVMAMMIIGLIAYAWRNIQLANLARFRFNIGFKVVGPDGEFLPNAKFQLFAKGGVDPILQNGDVITTNPHPLTNLVEFKNIPGGNYTVRMVGLPAGYRVMKKINATVYSVNDLRFRVKMPLLTKSATSIDDDYAQMMIDKDVYETVRAERLAVLKAANPPKWRLIKQRRIKKLSKPHKYRYIPINTIKLSKK
jgi:sortase A